MKVRMYTNDPACTKNMRIDKWIAVRMRQELNEMKNERERDCKPKTRKTKKEREKVRKEKGP